MIGALRASLSADTANFESGMKRAQRQAASSSSAISKSLGFIKAGFVGLASGISIGMLAQGIKGALDYAAGLGELAQQLGVTTRDLQVFRYAAGQTGISQEQMEKGLQKLTITLGQVAAGAKAPTAALKAIGISAKDLAGMDAGQAFRKIADGLAQVTDRSQRAAVEVALFGRSGAALDNLLSGGSASINELANAADELGIVLSADQIQRADDTADKLEAVKTVLMAKVAGTVADNASAIVQLADSLAYLVGQAGEAAAKMTAFYRSIAISSARFVSGLPPAAQKLLFGTKGSAAILRAGASAIRGNAADRAPVKTSQFSTGGGGGGIDQFLGSGGGGGKAKKGKGGGGGSDSAERARLDAIRDAYRFEEDQRRADQDILRAKQSLARDYVERTALSIQLLDIEKAGYEAELRNSVAMGERTQAQADTLRAQYDIKDALEREAVIADETAQRQQEFARLEEADFAIARRSLDGERQLATTAAERRDVELRILKLAYEEERRRLTRITQESKDWAEVEQARRELTNLDQNQANDTQGVMQSTRGPWEEYIGGIPQTAAEMEEAFQSVKVNAVDGLVQGLTDAATGAQKLGDVFKNVARQIIADLLRIQLQKAIVGALGNALGGLGGLFGGSAAPGVLSTGSLVPAPNPNAFAIPKLGFAKGGGFNVMGRGGVDRNVMSINGLPIARVSKGERVNISNGDVQGGASRIQVVPSPYFDVVVDGRAANVAAPMASRAAMVGAAGGQQGIMRQQQRRIP